MGSIVEITIKYKALLIGILAAALMLLILWWVKKKIKKKSRSREIEQAAKDRVRDEKLNQMILNQVGEKAKGRSKPYEVNYEYASSQDIDKRNKNQKNIENQIMVQLTENTELSTRKFVLNPKDGIRIGSAMVGNDIVLVNSEMADYQCEIFAVSDKIYIKSLSDIVRTIIKRYKEQAIIDGKGVRLLTGDRIVIGKVCYEVTIVK